MKTIKRDIVSAMVFSSDGLLFQGMKDPSSGGVYADCWHIPGGGIDQGETKEEAIVREIKEELGLDISKHNIELIDDEGRGSSEKTLDSGEKVICEMRFFIFKVAIEDQKADEIKIRLNDDLVKYRWTNLEELKDLKLTPPSVELFKKLKLII